ncbi:MAG: signal peptidase [Daejeonella sp.]
MRNKYMRRGVKFLLAGIILILVGYYLKDTEIMKYGWAMIIGYIGFGLGFLFILYSLMRKIERKSILEDRAEEAEHKESPKKSEG